MLKNTLKVLQPLTPQAVLFISYALPRETMRKQTQCDWHNSNHYLNVFVKPNEQCRACSDIVMARKRTFRGTKKNVFVKPNEQCRACSDIVMARIGNRQHGALGEVERQNALFEERKRTFYSGQHRLLFQTNIPSQSFFTFDITG